jgi:hypothetical protein
MHKARSLPRDQCNPEILLFSMLRLFRFLPAAQKQEFLQQVAEAAWSVLSLR